MNFSVVSLFPEMYAPFLATSLIKRAQEQGKLQVSVTGLFDFSQPKQRVDGPTFGHGAGMVIRPEVVERAVDSLEAVHGRAYKIFFSPRGTKLDQHFLQKLAQKISSLSHIMLLPGRYEGMDARIEDHYADEIISIGDYVLMGGDMPAMVFLEGLLRLLPGIVGKQESVERDSFSTYLVDYPEYTAPLEWKGLSVPEVIRSGNHKMIEQWRHQVALDATVTSHFEWLRAHELTPAQTMEVHAAIPPHYVALMHTDISLPGGIVGTTSVTSIDIHDIARSAATYGLKGFFIVTPLVDQKKIAQRLLDFWQEGAGITYNPQRHEALRSVHIVEGLTDVIAHIERIHGSAPLVIVTSAQHTQAASVVTYYDQKKVWGHKRPVLLVLGTGRGLAPVVIERADYALIPVTGYSKFNHLSVRSAAAVIFDRWLGKNERFLAK